MKGAIKRFAEIALQRDRQNAGQRKTGGIRADRPFRRLLRFPICILIGHTPCDPQKLRQSRLKPNSQIRQIDSLLSRIHSLLGRIKFAVPHFREFAAEPQP